METLDHAASSWLDSSVDGPSLPLLPDSSKIIAAGRAGDSLVSFGCLAQPLPQLLFAKTSGSHEPTTEIGENNGLTGIVREA